MLLMTLSMLLWFVVFGILIWVLVRWLTRSTSSSIGTLPAASAKEILHQRYARGEIDDAAFQRMLTQLEQSTLNDRT
jgi:uncharacterized membrane protein